VIKYSLVEKFKKKVYLRRDRVRLYISADLVKEIRRTQMKMEHEYKSRNRNKFTFNTIRASDYIAQIVREVRLK